jgi:hypothetical protein
MTITVANTALTNTFEYLVNRTNELANAMSTKAVTTNSNTTTGNAAITGKFTANVYTVGNSTVNTTFGSPNTDQITNGDYFLNANGSWALITAPITNGSVVTAGLVSQTVDEFPASDIRGAEYALYIKNDAANGYQISKVLTVHTGASGSAFSTEYGIVISNNILGTFSASVSGANVILSVTPTVANSTITFTRIKL